MIFTINPDTINYFQAISQEMGFAGRIITPIPYAWTTEFAYNVTGGGANSQFVYLNETAAFNNVNTNTQLTLLSNPALNWFYYGYWEFNLTSSIVGSAMSYTVSQFVLLNGVVVQRVIGNILSSAILTTIQNTGLPFRICPAQIDYFCYFSIAVNNGGTNCQQDFSFKFNGYKVFIA